MAEEPGRVRKLDRRRASEVVDVLCDAFEGYPTHEYVLGPSSEYSSDLHEYVQFVVLGTFLRGEWVLGLGGQVLEAAVTVSRSWGESPSEIASMRGALWESLGPAARAREQAIREATLPFQIEEPHLQIGMIGVRKALWGQGRGETLLEAVHTLSEADESAQGVALVTQLQRNWDWYERFGYGIIGQCLVDSYLPTWVLYRPNVRS